MTEKILITVKTYPTLSKKYAELVCTAGVTESGEWRRLYPIRFRQLYDQQKYKKYQWVEAELEKSASDSRPESYKILPQTLNAVGLPLPTRDNWRARRETFLNRVKVHDDLQQQELNKDAIPMILPIQKQHAGIEKWKTISH